MLALANSSGSIVESYVYDAYGNVTIRNGSGTVISTSAYGNRYLFQGREYDYTTQLYNFRARWYDPETGRWLSNDPIGISGGLNLYAFCSNDPINFVDPMGWAILKNKTSRPILVSGGLGTGRGHSNTTPHYAVLPPGEVGGGRENALEAYSTPQEAIAAYNIKINTYGPHMPSGSSLYDIDFYHGDTDGIKCDENNTPSVNFKVYGDDFGYYYDLTEDNQGNIIASMRIISHIIGSSTTTFFWICDKLPDTTNNPWPAFSP
ncbi:MAG: RHS repeat-associated core domain-containing protein [Clostridia bacterium]|nr:RHS repeat-associated core domain-containing protein [Clostridia bacterium]